MISLLRRASTRRWMQLATLLAAFERCVEATARLDGVERRFDHLSTHDVHQAVRLEQRLKTLEAHVDRACDRLTAERLILDVTEKRRRMAKADLRA